MHLSLAQTLVTVGGAALVAFILWFFFGARESVAARVATTDGPQEIDVTVRGGYSPDRIEVEAGRPVRLTFTREESTDCTETVAFPDFGVSAHLPQNQPVPVEFTPDKPGEFTFHCGMNMVRGRLIVKPPPPKN